MGQDRKSRLFIRIRKKRNLTRNSLKDQDRPMYEREVPGEKSEEELPIQIKD